MAQHHNFGAPFPAHPRDSSFVRETTSASAQPSSRASARINVTYEELSLDNIPHATTLSLYRERARNIRAVYERMWRCFAGNRVTEFMYDSQEGDGDDVSRIKNLRDYVNSHVRVIENLRIRVMRCAEAAKRWKRSNRSGGTLVKKMRARSQAVLEELIRLEQC